MPDEHFCLTLLISPFFSVSKRSCFEFLVPDETPDSVASNLGLQCQSIF